MIPVRFRLHIHLYSLIYAGTSEIRALVIARHSPSASYRDGWIRIEHRPVWWCDKAGLLYHFGQFGFWLRVMLSAFLFCADSMVITDNDRLFALSPLRLLGVKLIPSLHFALWPVKNRPTRRVACWLLKVDGWFFRSQAAATICVSPECERQVRELSRTLCGPIYQSRPQYRRAEFDGFETASIPSGRVAISSNVRRPDRALQGGVRSGGRRQ